MRELGIVQLLSLICIHETERAKINVRKELCVRTISHAVSPDLCSGAACSVDLRRTKLREVIVSLCPPQKNHGS